MKTATDTIVANSKDLKIKEIEYMPAGGSALKPASFEASDDNELLTIKFPQTLDVGKGALSLTFTGVLNDDLKGFYRSKYTGSV